MNYLARDLRDLGSIAATHELHARGHGKARLRTAVQGGEILRLRKGWYGSPELPLDVQRAARVGGRVGCVSAARLLGLWIPEGHPELHVAVTPGSCQLRTPNNYRRRLAERRGSASVVHWTDSRVGERMSVDVVTAIDQVCRCLPPEDAFVVCESARNHGLLSRFEWEVLRAGLPRRRQRALAAVGSASESGTESMFARRMRKIGIRFRQQVDIAGHRVDFLIGSRLVIEVDSRGYHDPTRDYVRDAHLSALGYRVLRFMYSQVVDAWDTVRDSVVAAISRGDHL